MKLIDKNSTIVHRFFEKKTLIKKAIPALLLVCLLAPAISQTGPNYLEKYWYYRERFKRFVFVSSNYDEAGTNIPAEWIGGNRMGWDDGNHSLKTYISMLATEYRLLKDYGQNYQTTIQELYYAIKSFERLDKTVEAAHRYSGSQYEWDFNGSFARHDLTEEFEAKYMPGGTYNNNQGYFESSLWRHFPDDPNYDIYYLNSMDNCWNLMEAFSLVHTLVDNEIVDGNLIDFKALIEENVRNIFDNMTHNEVRYAIDEVGVIPVLLLPYAIRITSKWYLEDAVTEELVYEGNGITTRGERDPTSLFASYGFEQVAHRILGEDLYNPTQFSETFFKSGLLLMNPVGAYIAGHLIAEMCPGFTLNVDQEVYLRGLDWSERLIDFGPNLWGCEELEQFEVVMWILRENDHEYNLRTLCATGNISDVTGKHPYDILIDKQNYGPKYPHEHLPLIWSILNNDYTKINQEDREYIQDLLDIAPNCGPHKYKTGGVLTYEEYEWSSASRLNRPDQRGGDIECWPAGEFAGLDYMLLHNLFWLTNEPLDNINNYTPGILFGLLPRAKFNITCSASINLDNKNIVLSAGNNIVLNPGFEVYGNGTFEANTTQCMNQDNYPVSFRKLSIDDYPTCD
jgi:hypothetical protein